MRTARELIQIDTFKPVDFIEITEKIEKAVKKSSIKDGVAILTTGHTTTALCINEKCERLQEDMKELLKRIAPPGAGYRHDHSTIDGRSNAHSHLLSLLLKTSEVIPVVEGRLRLGAWQSIFFIELDGPRSGRNVDVTVIG